MATNNVSSEEEESDDSLPSFTDTMNIKYSKERREKMIKKLVEFYKENDCLWNMRNPDFYNSSKKKEAWESIAKRMNTTWSEVKCCIYCLRCRLSFEMAKKRQHRCSEAPNFFLAEQFRFLLTSDKKKFVATEQTSNGSSTAMPQADKPKNQAKTDKQIDEEFYGRLYKIHETRSEKNLKKLRNLSKQADRKPSEPQASEQKTSHSSEQKTSNSSKQRTDLSQKLPEPQTPQQPSTPRYQKLEKYLRDKGSPLAKTVAELGKKAAVERN